MALTRAEHEYHLAGILVNGAGFMGLISVFLFDLGFKTLSAGSEWFVFILPFGVGLGFLLAALYCGFEGIRRARDANPVKKG